MNFLSIKSIKNKSTYFTKLLLTLVLVISLTIAILSFALYYLFQNYTIMQIQNYVKDSMSQISYSVDVMRERAKTISLQLYFDTDVSKLMLPSEHPINQQILALRKLEGYKKTDPFIHSIYLYNVNNESLYSTNHNNTKMSLENFPDKEVIDIIKGNSFKKLSPIPRTVINNAQGGSAYSEQKIFTFIFFESSNDTPVYLDNTIVINVSGEWLETMISDLSENTEDRIVILDNDGKCIMENSAGNFSKFNNIQSEVFPDLNDDSGSFIRNMDGIEYLITYISNAKLGWKFIRISDYKKSLKKLNTIKNTTMLVSVLMILAGLLISLSVSKRLYKPFEMVSKEVKALETEKRNNLYDYKQNFLRNLLLYGEINNLEKIYNKLSNFNIELDFNSRYAFVVLRINQYADFCNQYNIDERNNIKYAILRIVTGLFDNHYTNDTVNLGDKNIVIIFNQKMSISSDMDNIVKLIESVQYNVQHYLKMSLSACVSNEADSILDMYDTFHDCLKASNNLLFHGEHCILFTNDITKINNKNYMYPKKKEETLIEAFLLGRLPEVKEIYLEIINECLVLTFNIFYQTVLRLVTALNDTIYTLEENYNMIISHNFNTLITDINHYDSINAFNAQAFSIFESVLVQLESKKNSKHEDIYQSVMDIVTSKYHDVDLSIDQIAHILDISPAYLGRLFKRIASVSLTSYIMNYRLNIALNMLKSTDLLVQEIAERTGFSTIAHFYNNFKKIYGITPSQYRKTKKHEELPE